MEVFLGTHAPQELGPGNVWVTLTFAQSQDGKIAGANKRPLRLSGEKSMNMTHHLRAMHDAILVGIGTVLADDPRLNVRLDNYSGLSPRPVILDCHLQMPCECRLLQRVPRADPLVLCSEPADQNARKAWETRRQALEHAGAHIRTVETFKNPQGKLHLAWPSIFHVLAHEQLHSVMVEGGAAVIDSILASHHLLHKVIVTVSPVRVGEDGVGYTATPLQHAPYLQHVDTLELPPDTVFAWDVVPC